jgi:myo-inositol-1(or 4)-monophosphatase
MDLSRAKRAAVKAAYKGSEVLVKKFGHIQQVRKKGAIDLVTEADTESEAVIIKTLREVYPDHSFLAEESGHSADAGSNRCQWIVDPLDGTTNFAHQLPLFCISIALAVEEKLRVGVVLNPIAGELFSAVKGQGAELNGYPIRASRITKLSESLLVTGFPYDVASRMDEIIRRFDGCIRAAQGVRRLGSAALDLCYVACGRFEAFWEQNLKPWDTAAGVLIATEAGATVTDFNHQPFDINGNEILASNTHLHRQMVAVLALEETNDQTHE